MGEGRGEGCGRQPAYQEEMFFLSLPLPLGEGRGEGCGRQPALEHQRDNGKEQMTGAVDDADQTGCGPGRPVGTSGQPGEEVDRREAAVKDEKREKHPFATPILGMEKRLGGELAGDDATNRAMHEHGWRARSFEEARGGPGEVQVARRKRLGEAAFERAEAGALRNEIELPFARGHPAVLLGAKALQFLQMRDEVFREGRVVAGNSQEDALQIAVKDGHPRMKRRRVIGCRAGDGQQALVNDRADVCRGEVARAHDFDRGEDQSGRGEADDPCGQQQQGVEEPEKQGAFRCEHLRGRWYTQCHLPRIAVFRNLCNAGSRVEGCGAAFASAWRDARLRVRSEWDRPAEVM